MSLSLEQGEPSVPHHPRYGDRQEDWTREEEAYASILIKAFKSGLHIFKKYEGVSLRSYLVDKLHCNPSRISKRYTGIEGLGKRFRVSPTPSSDDTIVTQIYDCEQQFLASLVTSPSTNKKERKRRSKKNMTLSSFPILSSEKLTPSITLSSTLSSEELPTLSEFDSLGLCVSHKQDELPNSQLLLETQRDGQTERQREMQMHSQTQISMYREEDGWRERENERETERDSEETSEEEYNQNNKDLSHINANKNDKSNNLSQTDSRRMMELQRQARKRRNEYR
mmetsp:Transcript_9588/g.9639  ORF Transcript_9588/g.9639 Transcript_9588/m.9639 type:complete len:282 (-) Transcript_9588:12-857(-)